MEDFFDRLDKYMQAKGLNDNQVTVTANLSIGSLGKQRKGSRGLSSESIAKILQTYSDLNADWLLTGNGTMIKDKRDIIEELKNSRLKLNYPKEPKKIPLVTISAVAGFGNADFSIKESDVKDYYVVPKFKDRKVDFMTEVTGSSMYPNYNPGDVVACTILRESKFIQWNKVHIIGTHEQGILVKRVKKGPDEDHLLLVSDNKDYDPFTISKEEITGMALVIGVIRLE